MQAQAEARLPARAVSCPYTQSDSRLCVAVVGRCIQGTAVLLHDTAPHRRMGLELELVELGGGGMWIVWYQCPERAERESSQFAET